MTPQQFDELFAASGLAASITAVAAYRVLVDGITAAEAARECGIDPGGLSRYLARFPTAICTQCGAVKKPARGGPKGLEEPD